MKNLIDTLKKSLIFQNFPADILKKGILPHGWTKEYAKGSYIYMKTDKIDRIGVVLSGHVNLLHIFDDGNYTIINTLEPSEILGADLLFTKTRISPHYAMASTPVQIFFLPETLFQKAGFLPDEYRFEIMHRLLNLVSQENMKKEHRLAILYQKGLRDRIMEYLTMQAEKQGSGCITIPFSREELASFLCVNRTALSHELSKMRAEGIIEFRKNRFTLTGNLIE